MSPSHKAASMYTAHRQTMLAGSDIDLFIPTWTNATPLTRKAWIAAYNVIEGSKKKTVEIAIEARPIEIPPGHKHCPGCKLIRPKQDFGLRDGGAKPRSRCFACAAEERRLWTMKNLDSYNAYQREYRARRNAMGKPIKRKITRNEINTSNSKSNVRSPQPSHGV